LEIAFFVPFANIIQVDIAKGMSSAGFVENTIKCEIKFILKTYVVLPVVCLHLVVPE
jgi:hypothetical protein